MTIRELIEVLENTPDQSRDVYIPVGKGSFKYEGGSICAEITTDIKYCFDSDKNIELFPSND